MPVCLVTHVNPNNYLDFLLIKCRAIALFMSVSDVRQGLKFKSGSRSICFHRSIPYLLIPLTREASSSSVNHGWRKVASEPPGSALANVAQGPGSRSCKIPFDLRWQSCWLTFPLIQPIQNQ